MRNSFNYIPGETLATGFVRPKVTALFFDKLWIPESLLDTSFEFSIPKEILVHEARELTVKNKWLAGDYFEIARKKNTPARPVNFNCFEESNTPKFKYSKYRNYAIMVSAESFSRKYGLHIFPVYYTLTDFERDIEHLNYHKLHKQPLRFLLKKPNTFLNKDVFAICIQDFPSITEDELSWEQVLDYRKDKKSIQKLRKFTTWATRTFSNASPEQIRETINYELDLYKSALIEHGIKTSVGGFSTIVSSASSIIALLSNPSMTILPMLSIASISLSFTVNTYFSILANKNNPIAYLYDITQGI